MEQQDRVSLVRILRGRRKEENHLELQTGETGRKAQENWRSWGSMQSQEKEFRFQARSPGNKVPEDLRLEFLSGLHVSLQEPALRSEVTCLKSRTVRGREGM